MREMVKELKEFGIQIYGYDPLLSKEEIGSFDVKAFNELNVKMDCVIMAAAHNEFKHKLFFKKETFTKEKLFLSTGSFS